MFLYAWKIAVTDFSRHCTALPGDWPLHITHSHFPIFFTFLYMSFKENDQYSFGLVPQILVTGLLFEIDTFMRLERC